MTNRTLLASLTSAITTELTTASTTVFAWFDNLRERNSYGCFSVLEEGNVGKVDLPGLGRNTLLGTKNCHITGNGRFIPETTAGFVVVV